MVTGALLVSPVGFVETDSCSLIITMNCTTVTSIMGQINLKVNKVQAVVKKRIRAIFSIVKADNIDENFRKNFPCEVHSPS